MLEKLSEKEIQFMEAFYYPIAQAECLFSDYGNLAAFEDDKLAHVRLVQYPLFSHEYLLDYDPDLPVPANELEKANFALRKNAGDVYALGGRLFGKTHCVEKLDFLISINMLGAEKCGFTSYDALHIRGVLEELVTVLEHHPYFKIYEPQITRNPNYRFAFKTGYLLESVNMNVLGKSPGKSFFQKHFTRLYIEEASLETEQVYNIRRDSVSELGCVFRVAGMTNFTKYSPCGRVFYDYSQRGKVVNLPQYCNPRWSAAEKDKAVKDFGGESSVNFKIFIKGEVAEEGVSVFDMDRVRKCYDDKRTIKVYEVNKKNFQDYEQIVHVVRPANATECIICSDVGETAPSEVCIFFKINDVYRYAYNIVLFNLTDKEQFKIFKWLGETLGANYISVDTTDGLGRAIHRSLAEVFPQPNIIWCSFNEKLPVDFEKDDKGELVTKDGKPVYKEEYVTEWSVKRLKDLLYGERLDLPIDYKFDQQINSVVSMRSGTRTLYECISQEDHLYQSFQVFAIVQWLTEFLNLNPIKKSNFCKGGV